MKKVILLLCLLPDLALGQIVQNFESGNLNGWSESVKGRWKADTTQSISGRYSLHHIFDNADAGTDQAGIGIDSLHPSEGAVKWSFTIRHGYDPSSSNNWAVFLMSDTDPSEICTEGNTNGYAVGVNLSGYDDTLRIWKVKGDAVSAVVSFGINWQSLVGTTNAVKITVERDPGGKWDAALFLPADNLLSEASGIDNELFPCRWLILSYKYSSSRDRLLWFDDLRVDGIFYYSNKVPSVKSCAASGKSTVLIELDDEPDNDFGDPTNFYLLPGGQNPLSVIRESSFSFALKFRDELISCSDYELTVKSICNRNGKCMNDLHFPFTPLWPETGDIVISEIMADPEPVVSLPPDEYIEITNNRGFTSGLKNWKLVSGDQEYLLPEVNIGPFGILILCSAKDTSEFSPFGRVLGLKQFPVLTDNGKMLLLYDAGGTLIHGVEYSNDWYGDEMKSDGGWSLEMVDTRNPFSCSANWAASRSKKGGTPGTVNSVKTDNPDESFSGDLTVFPEDSINIVLRSQESLFCMTEMKDSIFFDGRSPETISLTDPLFRQFLVRLGKPLGRGKLYRLDIQGKIRDFAGNRLVQKKCCFGLPEEGAENDILFNELLFNPFPGDPDYVELYNGSDKILDASRLELVSVAATTGDTSQIYPLSGQPQCILPGEYFAVTTDIGKISERYLSGNPDFLFEVGSLPSMPDDKGHLLLFSRELVRIDEVAYSEKMQSSLLSGYDGVALEKISPGSSSGDIGSWHSASESSGWGTPGAPNSVFSDNPPQEDIVSLSSTRITPDDDGIEDMLIINFNLQGNSNIVSVTIFDEWGNYVRKLADNMYAGPSATLAWDGIADDGSMAGTGIYIVYVSMFDESGKTHKWKKVCASNKKVRRD